MTAHRLDALLPGTRALGPRLADWLAGAPADLCLEWRLRSREGGRVGLWLVVDGGADEVRSLGRLMRVNDTGVWAEAPAPALLPGPVLHAEALSGPLEPAAELEELARLLALQPTPCELRVRCSSLVGLPRDEVSPRLGQVESLLQGVHRVEEGRQTAAELPHDLVLLRREKAALLAALGWREALAEGALTVRVEVRGVAGADLLACASRALVGAARVVWREEPCPIPVPVPVVGRMLRVEADALPGLPVRRGRVRRLGGPALAGALLGEAQGRRGRREVRLADPDLARHLYVCGKTGVGKSTLLETLVRDLGRSGSGVALIDPHGDLVDKLKDDFGWRRRVVFDPLSGSCPGLDPLWNDGSIRGQERALERLTAILWRLFPPEYMGAEFDRHARALLLPLIHAGEPLESVVRMDADEDFRRRMVDQLVEDDPVHAEVQRFWRREVPQWSSSERSEMRGFTLSKFQSLLRSPAMRRACGAGRPQLDLGSVADHHQVLLARLPQGELGPVTAWFLGMLLMSRLQDAVFARASRPAQDRTPFPVVIDEFQNFVGGGGFGYTRSDRTLGPLLSEGRKYGLRLVLANQYLSQLDEGTRASILGNVGNLIVFRTGGADAELLAEELGVPAGELVDLPLYTAVARVLRQGQRLEPVTLTTVVGGL